jgi:hypothetical protein
MIRIQVTSPFTYEYFNGDDKLIKRHYLSAGNYYHLDEEKDKDEIKYILSPNFIFKNYIYINLETIPKALIKEFELDNGFYEDTAVPEDEYIPTLLQNNKFLDVSESYFTDDLASDPVITQEPSVNIFDKTTIKIEEETKIEIIEQPEVIEKEEELGAENTPYLAPDEILSEEYEDVDTSDKERLARQTELEDLHYSKVKEIAELYNLEYHTKKQTIQEILDLEFASLT